MPTTEIKKKHLKLSANFRIGAEIATMPLHLCWASAQRAADFDGREPGS
jgi:hypothetical protein